MLCSLSLSLLLCLLHTSYLATGYVYSRALTASADLSRNILAALDDLVLLFFYQRSTWTLIFKMGTKKGLPFACRMSRSTRGSMKGTRYMAVRAIPPHVCSGSRNSSSSHTAQRCHAGLSLRTRGVMVGRPTQRRRPGLVPLSLCFSLQGVPASGSLEAAYLQSPPALVSSSLSRLCGTIFSRSSTSLSTSTRTNLLLASGVGGWKLCSSTGSADERSVGGESENDGSSSSFPGARRVYDWGLGVLR